MYVGVCTVTSLRRKQHDEIVTKADVCTKMINSPESLSMTQRLSPPVSPLPRPPPPPAPPPPPTDDPDEDEDFDESSDELESSLESSSFAQNLDMLVVFGVVRGGRTFPLRNVEHRVSKEWKICMYDR